ncbi:hypothetical protein ACLOJK_031432 [Asimina triloba]
MAAAILRTRSTLLSSATAPPPSPIATGKGLRSAAVNDPTLYQFLHSSLKIPELTLPPSYLGRIAPRIPAEIDLASLVNGDHDSLHRLLESAAGLGVFQIVGNGVSAPRIGDAIRGSDQVFGGVPKWRKLEMDRYFGLGRGPNKVREDLFWFGAGAAAAGKEMEEQLAQHVGAETIQMVSENMGKLFAELEAVAEKVGRVLSKHAREQQQQQGMKRIQEQESVLCVHKYSSSDDIHQHEINPAVQDGQMESDEESSHAFLLHVSDRDLEFRVRSKKSSFSFSASAGAIVVTFGQQLQASSF